MTQKDRRPPPIHNPPLAREEIEFSHPSEREFASMLDYYGIEWQYEPTTFPLKWGERGKLLEAFSPDFFLVQQDLYVELTTLRRRLMSEKRRKIRQLKKLYPEVNIQLWDRKDFEKLLQKFGLEDHSDELIGKKALSEDA